VGVDQVPRSLYPDRLRSRSLRLSYYEFLLFLHITGAVIWVGGGTALAILGTRAGRAPDVTSVQRFFDQSSWVSNRVLAPASIVVLAAGILLVIEGPWSFGDLWVLLGLGGFAATGITGLVLFMPRTKAINAMIASGGTMTPEAAAHARELVLLTRIDYAGLFVVVAAMALKPTTDDAGTLVVMGAFVIAAVAAVMRSVRATAELRRTAA
jgi:uncharacterized membrane protein